MIYCVMGPTASGKTAYSLKLAKELDGEIISVDSRQIYIGMDIGTAKEAPRPDSSNEGQPLWQQSFEIEGVPHFLIDILKPDQRYTAFDFKEQAQWLIKDIESRGKVPILVGGTGLYFDVLLYDFQPGEEETMDDQLRAELQERFEQEGGEQLWKELREVDPRSAARIHYNNGHYLIRALEYFKVTGKPKSEANKKNDEFVYEVELIGFEWPREQLYERIELRIDQQMEAGLLDEVRILREAYKTDLPAMTSLGYQELSAYLEGKCDLDEAIALFKRNTRRYAKRQLTWLRRYGEKIQWQKTG